MQQDFEREMQESFWRTEFAFPKMEKSSESAVSAILLGIVILSDWDRLQRLFQCRGGTIRSSGICTAAGRTIFAIERPLPNRYGLREPFL